MTIFTSTENLSPPQTTCTQMHWCIHICLHYVNTENITTWTWNTNTQSNGPILMIQYFQSGSSINVVSVEKQMDVECSSKSLWSLLLHLCLFRGSIWIFKLPFYHRKQDSKAQRTKGVVMETRANKKVLRLICTCMDGNSGLVAHTAPLCSTVIVLPLKNNDLLWLLRHPSLSWQLNSKLLALVQEGVRHHFPSYQVGISVFPLFWTWTHVCHKHYAYLLHCQLTACFRCCVIWLNIRINTLKNI